jgi:hypothetical protein
MRSFHAHKQAAAQTSELCHLKNRDITAFTFLYEAKHNGGIKCMRDKGNKKGVNDEDTKGTKPHEFLCSVAVVRTSAVAVQYNRRGMQW